MSELREKIAAKIAPHMRLISFNPDCETQEQNKQYALEVADTVLALIQKEQGWREIESAPKDGTHILITSFNTANWSDGVDRSYWQTQTAHFSNGHWVTESYPDSQYGYSEIEYLTAYASGPTHWQPLPTPPQVEDET